MVDRRTFQRLPANFLVRFLDLISGVEGVAQTCDISAQGIGLVTYHELQPDTPLQLWLQLPNKDWSVCTTGKVVWAKMIEPNQYRAGISLDKTEFLGISAILDNAKP